ncbi:DUF3568 domain-containing protein [Desulfosarcina sp. OttesenSCG-928-A07]|nr:DUF3568 domain-containing protein [Desulfosarcina sp. OttesenSCG-928-G17]MDL2330047.1 DUF3568 domain-containing protein [Desulfosarcina sp. OttesenSCG-928-A07]
MTHFTVLICALLFVSGCTAGVAALAGAGTGAGVYTWVKGELIRAYPQSFEQTQTAVYETLKSMSITIDEKTETASKVSLKATQGDGTPVFATIDTKDYNMTEVSVRCGRIGYWDRETAEKIHAKILASF